MQYGVYYANIAIEETINGWCSLAYDLGVI